MEASVVAKQADDAVISALDELGSRVPLSFPVSTKEGFVTQLVAYGSAIEFVGERYDTQSIARLIPDYFFPISDEKT